MGSTAISSGATRRRPPARRRARVGERVPSTSRSRQVHLLARHLQADLTDLVGESLGAAGRTRGSAGPAGRRRSRPFEHRVRCLRLGSIAMASNPRLEATVGSGRVADMSSVGFCGDFRPGAAIGGSSSRPSRSVWSRNGPNSSPNQKVPSASISSTRGRSRTRSAAGHRRSRRRPAGRGQHVEAEGRQGAAAPSGRTPSSTVRSHGDRGAAPSPAPKGPLVPRPRSIR